MANRKELNPTDRELLENILDLEVEELRDDQIEVLRARRDYLNSDEVKRFREVLEVKEESAKKSLDKMNRAELEVEAQEAGVEITEDMKTNKDIVVAIRAAREE